MPRKFDGKKIYDTAVARFLATMSEVDHNLKASELKIQAHENAKWMVEKKVKIFEDWIDWRRSLSEDERFEPLTFNIVELDMGDPKEFGWASSPSKDAAQFDPDDELGDDAKNEKRSYIKLAGGQLLAWFVVDPRVVSGELVYRKRDRWGRINPNHDKTPLWLVCHWPKNPIEKDTNFLGEAIHLEGCEGYGYIPIEMTPKEIKKLRLVRTIEASDPDEAGCEVRESMDRSKGSDGPHGNSNYW